jgi:hypothetical protein
MLACVASMAGELLQGGGASRMVRLQIIVFLFSLAIFLISPVVQVSDSRYTALLSECLLHHGSPELDEYYKVPVPWLTGLAHRPDEANEYQLEKARGHVTYFFPHGSSILSMPLVAVMNAAGISAATTDGRLNLAGEIKIERVIASLLMAALTCVFFAMAAMMLPLTWSFVVALGASMGSQILSTASRGLWSHTWELFLCGLIAFSLLNAAHRKQRIRPVWLATLVAWAFFVRPTGAAAIVAVSGYVWWVHRRELIAYAAALTGWLAAFAGYWWLVFNTVLPSYFLATQTNPSSFIEGFAGNLIGPSRGLFVFVPSTLFVFYLVVRYRKHVIHRSLALYAFVQIIALAIIIARFYRGQGYSYGPRYFAEAIPSFVLLAILGLDAMRRAKEPSPHRIEIAAAIFLVAVSVAMNARGAWSFAGLDWTLDRQSSLDVFDWRYPQFLAGLIAPPKD